MKISVSYPGHKSKRWREPIEGAVLGWTSMMTRFASDMIYTVPAVLMAIEINEGKEGRRKVRLVPLQMDELDAEITIVQDS